MESKVKSRISNNTYTASLSLLEPEDRDLDSELYQITISGRNILIAPGKNKMEEGIAYGYAYAIRGNKVVCKLGVYEKKTETMPLIFDLSLFPEGSMCLFEEYDKNPSLLVDLEMSDKATLFDYLIPLFQKMEDKKKKLKLAFKNLHYTYNREKKDKEIKPILNKISAASKEDDPNDTFLHKLQEEITDTKQFVLTLLALQYVFQVEFEFMTDDPSLLEMISRWKVGKVSTVIEVDVSTQEMIREKAYQEPAVIPDLAEPTEPTVEPTIEPTVEPEPLPEPMSKPLLRPLGPPEEMKTSIEPEPVVQPLKLRKKREPKAGTRLGTSLNDVGVTEAPKTKIRLKKKPEA